MGQFRRDWRQVCFPQSAAKMRPKLGATLTSALKRHLQVDLGNGERVTVEQDHTRADHLGSIAWDSAVFCCGLLPQLQRVHAALDFSGKSLLELGSGTGLVGIACAKLGGRCTLTDRCTELTKKSVLLSKVDARCLDYSWGREVPEELQGKQYDFIVCSDVLYDSASHPCLLKALREFWGEKTVLMIAYKRRWAVPEKSFFEELESVLGVKLSVFAVSADKSIFLLLAAGPLAGFNFGGNA